MLSHLFRESRTLLLASLTTGLASGLCGAGLVKLIGDGIQGGAVLERAVLFFLLCASYLLMKASSELSLIHLTQTAVFRLRVTLSQKIIRTPLKKLQALGKHELLAILTNDVGAFIGAFQIIPSAFGNLIIIVACFGYMAWLSTELFLIFVTILALGTSSFLLAERAPRARFRVLRDQVDILYKHFRSLIEGTKELQLNAQRGQMFVGDVLTSAAQSYKKHYLSAMGSYTWVNNVGIVFFYFAIGVLLFIIPLWLPQNKSTITTYTLMLLFLIRPVSEMMTAVPLFRQATVAWNKIQQIESVLGSEARAPTTENVFDCAGPRVLELRGVCYGYPRHPTDGAHVVGPFDLSVREGEILYIVGGNGSGKTTLAMLLLGFYEPASGAVILNGTEVTKDNLEDYRAHFSAVFSDFHLFEDLLGTNSNSAATTATQLLKDFELSHKVHVTNGRFSTIDLSTGQRKRLALVSSFVEDREICLFDEWAADQDPIFKRLFYTEILPRLKARGKTVIVITHDDAYFAYADRVVKLEDGKVA